MEDHPTDRPDRHTKLRIAGSLVAAILVALSFVALIWSQGWSIPFLVGYVSVKIAVKVGALVVGGLIALAAWRHKRRNRTDDSDRPESPGPVEGAPAKV